jgi:hypothetical protein
MRVRLVICTVAMIAFNNTGIQNRIYLYKKILASSGTYRGKGLYNYVTLGLSRTGATVPLTAHTLSIHRDTSARLCAFVCYLSSHFLSYSDYTLASAHYTPTSDE